MIPVFSLLIVLTLSILVTRVATVALTHTGLSQQAAKFQARSAFTGVGFTTNEAEKVVNHPVRRRVLMLLMLLGNAGIATAISSMLLTFVDTDAEGTWFWRVVLLVAGVAVLWTVAQSSVIDRHLSRFISWELSTTTELDTRDYARLLHLGGDFTVTELLVQDDDWMADSTLQELKLRDEGILVLGIHASDGEFRGVPTPRTRVRVGDTLVVYGRQPKINELSERGRNVGGEMQHLDAVSEQRELERESDKAEERREQREGEDEPNGAADEAKKPKRGQ